MTDLANFGTYLDSYVAGCQAIHTKHGGRDTLQISYGKRYVKIVKYPSQSVHSFVDPNNGDVLKPAGWARPAKHARGNIFDAYNGLKGMGPYGPAYLR